jgi:hypothetical protein
MLGAAPGPDSRALTPAITRVPFLALQPAIPFLGLVQQAAHSPWHFPQYPRPSPQHRGVVILRSHRGLALGLPVAVDEVQALGQTAPPLLRRLTQLRQLPELLGPFLTTATLGAPAADPTQAVRLDGHQARPLAEKDLSGGGLFDTRAAELIQDGQQGSAASPGLLGQAAELGHAGRLAFLGGLFGGGPVQEYGREAAADREADAFGLGRAGKGGEAVAVEEEGVGEQVLEFGGATPQGSDLSAELLELLSRVAAVAGVQDGLGIAVEGLSGETQLAGALRDLAVGAVENGGSVGAAEFVG